jgi:hypothetical protein
MDGFQQEAFGIFIRAGGEMGELVHPLIEGQAVIDDAVADLCGGRTMALQALVGDADIFGRLSERETALGNVRRQRHQCDFSGTSTSLNRLDFKHRATLFRKSSRLFFWR